MGYVADAMDGSCSSTWLPALFIEHEYSSTERSILDIFTKKFHTIKNPSFQDAWCVFAKGQWLLMCRRERLGFSQFLINPVSGVRVDLPVHDVYFGVATFSLTSGFPDVIVNVTNSNGMNSGIPPPSRANVVHDSGPALNSSFNGILTPIRHKPSTILYKGILRTPTPYKAGLSGMFSGTPTLNRPSRPVIIRIIRPGDEAWEEHSVEGTEDAIFLQVVLSGRQVTCVDKRGMVLEFDLFDHTWRFSSPENRAANLRRSVVECDGEVVSVESPRPVFRCFQFTRFDRRMMKWVALEEDKLENASWLMCSRSSGCMWREEGRKVYTLSPNEYSGPRPRKPDYTRSIRIDGYGFLNDTYFDYNVYVHDLGRGPADGHQHGVFHETKGTVTILPQPVRARNLRWVGADTLC